MANNSRNEVAAPSWSSQPGSHDVGAHDGGILSHYPLCDKLDDLGRYDDNGIAGGEGVAVGEDHFFGAVVAEGGFVVAANNGEGVEDVGDRGSPPFLDHRTAPPKAW